MRLLLLATVAGCYAPSVAPGGADARPGVDGADAACVFDDLFDDGVLDTWPWMPPFSDGMVTVSEANDDLIMQFAAGMVMAGASGGIQTTDPFDARGRRFGAQVVETPAMAQPVATVLFLFKDNQNWIGIRAGQGLLSSQTRVDDVFTNHMDIQYTTSAYPYWGLSVSQEGTTVYFETSGNGADWIIFDDVPAPFDLSSMTGILQVLADAPADSPGQSRFAEAVLCPR